MRGHVAVVAVSMKFVVTSIAKQIAEPNFRPRFDGWHSIPQCTARVVRIIVFLCPVFRLTVVKCQTLQASFPTSVTSTAHRSNDDGLVTITCVLAMDHPGTSASVCEEVSDMLCSIAHTWPALRRCRTCQVSGTSRASQLPLLYQACGESQVAASRHACTKHTGRPAFGWPRTYASHVHASSLSERVMPAPGDTRPGR